MAKIKKETKTAKKVFERTIEKDLFDAWQMQYRTGDVVEIMQITGKSYPIIQRALHFGHVKNEDVCDTISEFYIKRRDKQKEQSKRISSN